VLLRRLEGIVPPPLSMFWDQLLQLIEEGKVVPVIGQDLLTVPESTGHRFLYPLLADRLANYLGVPTADLPVGSELNEVACRYLDTRKSKVGQIYSALKSVAAEVDALPVPEPLLQLAAIRPFSLYVTTTFDSCLVRALNQTRFGGQAKTKVLAHAPTEVDDLAGELRSASVPTVYHLMGKLSATPAYAVTQEDMIEFFHSLQSDTRRPAQLFHELSCRSLLLLGTRFSGWLTSFMMRMAKGQRLSADDKTDYVADNSVTHDENLVLFLERFSRATEIFRGNPAEFVAELHQHWTERHPGAAQTSAPTVSSPGSASDTRQGAVFLSYASGDVAAVEKLKTALDVAGVDVFFDRDELQPGADWEVKLRRTIHECSLFIPVISSQTLTPDRRFFRAEWNLALKEAEMASFSPEAGFLLPVVIDDTAIDDPALPAKFQQFQWRSLPGGEPSPEFIAHVVKLYRARQAGAGAGAA